MDTIAHVSRCEEATLHRSQPTSRRLQTIGLIAAASLSAAGCGGADGVFGETLPTYRYRLTVEINTPEGIRRGSGVIQVESSQAGQYNLDAPYVGHQQVRGDAIVINLGRRGRIFVVLKDHYNRGWPVYIMPRFIEPVIGASRQDTRRIAIERILALRGPIALHAHIDDARYPLDDWLPDLVTFSNSNDLTTARIVQPDELSSTFGAGVNLRGMTVQITSDPVTRSAEVRALPWLSDHAAYLRNNRRPSDGTSAGDLDEIDFSEDR